MAVIVVVRHLVMLASFVLRAPVLVGVGHRGVVVLVTVVVRLVLEGPHDLTALVMVRDVVMVVGVGRGFVEMRVLDVADDFLARGAGGRGMRLHRRSSLDGECESGVWPGCASPRRGAMLEPESLRVGDEFRVKTRSRADDRSLMFGYHRAAMKPPGRLAPIALNLGLRLAIAY